VFAGCEQLLSFLARVISNYTYLNLMGQYQPCHRAREFPELARPITSSEYREALAIAERHGLARLA
jgi:putative pyruvate formate lyase activating enzyme